MIRVVNAEDSLIVREGLQQILAASPDVEVVACCGELGAAIEAIERERPDVVVTDIRMPPSETDEGIHGWGESGLSSREKAVSGRMRFTARKASSAP